MHKLFNSFKNLTELITLFQDDRIFATGITNKPPLFHLIYLFMIKHTLLAVMMVLSFGLVNAQDSSVSGEKESFAVVSSKKANQYQVVFLANDATRLNLELRDQNGNQLFSDAFTAKGYFSKSFDLGQLSSGTYTFRASYNGQTIEETVSTVSSDELLGQRLKVQPVVGNTKYRFELAGLADTDYEVVIYDADNKVLYRQSIAPGERYARLFNLEQADSREVTFVLSSDNASASRRFVLR